MRTTTLVLAVSTAITLAACADTSTGPADGAMSPASALLARQPLGQGANGCYQLYAGGTLSGATVLVSGKFNVGNSASVVIAGDCDGGAISLVDDGLSVTLTNPSPLAGGSSSVALYTFCGGTNTGSAAIDVTSLFKPGTNTFELTLTNDCGGTVSAPALYLVVRQR
jgi:hypothetical protein